MHSLPTRCFFIFSQPAFIKNNFSPPASGTFGFARHTTCPDTSGSRTFAKPKEPFFFQRLAF